MLSQIWWSNIQIIQISIVKSYEPTSFYVCAYCVYLCMFMFVSAYAHEFTFV